jgi:hypothetical protein
MASVSSGGKPYTLLRKLLTELAFSAVLKDSAGAELSTYVKNLDVALSTIKSKTDNLDVLLSTRASEATVSGIKSQTDKLNFDSANRLRVSPANAEVILPVDIQAR